jgi:hypothetical protein
MSDLQKAEALLTRGRIHPSDPLYRKPVMIGSTAGLTERGQFPEYEEWIARRNKSDAC